MDISPACTVLRQNGFIDRSNTMDKITSPLQPAKQNNAPNERSIGYIYELVCQSYSDTSGISRSWILQHSPGRPCTMCLLSGCTSQLEERRYSHGRASPPFPRMRLGQSHRPYRGCKMQSVFEGQGQSGVFSLSTPCVL